MDWLPNELKRLYEDTGLKVDWKTYRAVVEEFKREVERAREIRRKSADWSYIESRPEPLKTALKTLVETGDLWYSAAMTGVPVDELNEERIKAKIPLVVV